MIICAYIEYITDNIRQSEQVKIVQEESKKKNSKLTMKYFVVL